MRLYDRIIGAGFASVIAADPPAYVQGILQSTVRFDITNIAEYLDSFPDDKTWNLSDAVSLMMPFEHMWMEWQTPAARAGLLAVQSEQEDGTDGNLAQHFDVFLDSREFHGLAGGRPIHIGGILFVVDGCDGSYVADSASYIVSEELAGVSRWRDVLRAKLPIINMALSLMHCKNVEIVDAESTGTRQQRRFEERRGIQVAQFKMLVIDPSMTQKRYEGANRQPRARGTRSMHIARGHFATYSEDRPLFGKYSGTFWKPAHVRGSADVGMVGKDYAVKAPKP